MVMDYMWRPRVFEKSLSRRRGGLGSTTATTPT